jgi:hypothetical protein
MTMQAWAEEDYFPVVLIPIEKYVTLEMIAQSPFVFVSIPSLR